jgi:dolichol-phosphate mannosyltransferase
MTYNQNTGFSIIIPTFQEASNIPELVQRIASVNFNYREFEVLLIDDDSQDGIIDVVQQLSVNYPWLKLIVRREERNLSQSIMTGFQRARFPILVTMDADLSHPPEEIPAMLTLLEPPHIDMVIGSRYISGGSVDEKWPWIRKLTSYSAALIARVILFANVKDPLSGFLALRKSTLLAGQTLKPIGWKIGLEIIVKCRCKSIREIPIHFSQRHLGTSKLNLKISFAYLRHILRLISFKLTPS